MALTSLGFAELQMKREEEEASAISRNRPLPIIQFSQGWGRRVRGESTAMTFRSWTVPTLNRLW